MRTRARLPLSPTLERWSGRRLMETRGNGSSTDEEGRNLTSETASRNTSKKLSSVRKEHDYEEVI